MQEIKINQITKFNSIDSFSYKINEESTCYSTPNTGFLVRKPYLAVKKSGEVVLRFQNIVQRFFDLVLHGVFTIFKISHETSDLSVVWQALKNQRFIQSNEQSPTASKNTKIREALSKIIGLHLAHFFPSYNPASDLSVLDFQKYAYYLEQYENERAIAFLNSIHDLNGYFISSKHTPLTLAIQKENFEIIQHLVAIKNKDSTLAVDPNKPTLDGRSPLQLAVHKDLPRKFFMALFQAGACPKNEKEIKDIISLAGDNTKLIQAITDLSNGKPISWPAPQHNPAA